MSTKELFGDSSDEDDDDYDDEQPEQEVAAASPAVAATSAAEATNSDNNNTKGGGGGGGEEKEEQASPPAAAAPAAAPARKKIADDEDDDDDDDDEDEPEFDDQGAVVGLTRAAPTIKAAKEKEKTALQSFLAQDGDADGDGADGPFSNDKPMKPPPPPVKKRIVDKRNKLIIQDTALIRPSPTSVSMYITKLPNLMGVQPVAFDPMAYSADLEEEDFGPSAVHNLVRWRYKTDPVSGQQVRDDNNNLVRESNTRLVEWEDGTFTIHVGTEAMEIDIKNNSDAQGFAGLNGYMYLSQKATLKTTTGGDKDDDKDNNEEKQGDDDDDNNAASKPAGTVLECMGPIVSRMTARPSSLQSEAHKSLTLAVRQKTIKKARIAEYVTQEDPEKIKQERIKANTDLQRQKVQQQSRGGGGGGGGRRSGGRSRPRMSRAYLEGGEEEDDDNYDSFNIRDTKRKMRDGDQDFDDYGNDDDDDDDAANDTAFNRGRGRATAGNRRAAAAASAEKDEEIVMDDENDDDDDDDDEEEAAPVVKKVKKAAHRAFDDDDDSD